MKFSERVAGGVAAEQFRLRTAYRDVIARISRLCHDPHLASHTQLLLDGTGKGEPVEEMLRDAKLPVSLVPLNITSGGTVGVRGSWRNVPKAELVTTLELLLERGHLKISSDIPHGDLLREELRRFERRSEVWGGIRA